MKNTILLFLLFSNFFIPRLSFSQEKEPSNEFLLQAVKEELPKYLEMVKKDKIQNYGFQTETEMSEIELGEPIQTCYLSKDFYSDEKLNRNNYIVYAKEYRIPLLVSEEVRCFVVAGTINGQWKLVSIGESIYAKNAYNAKVKYDFEKDKKIKLLIEPNSRTSYFFQMNDSDQTVDFFPTGENDEMKIEKKKYSQSDLFTKLHQQYKKKQHEEDN